MKKQEKAFEKLANTEKALRELAANALLEGDYESASVIGTLAHDVGRLSDSRGIRNASESSSRNHETRPPNNALLLDSKKEGAPATILEAEGKSTPISARTREGHKPGKRRATYPHFFRDGDILVKVGWSKTRKSEYEHRAPYVALRAFVEVLASLGSRKSRFVIEDALPVVVNNEEVPSYQAYLCLGWLRSKDLVVQHGRQGYSLSNMKSFIGQMEQEWTKQRALEA